MKFAYQTPNFGFLGDAALLADLASEAEAAGWDGFFLWDHLQWPAMEPNVDPWIALAAMSMRTQRLQIGTLITPVARRDIIKLARETVSVDRLSNGRLILGVGLGWDGIPEWSAFGHETDPKIRGEMLDEGLALLNALWSGEPVNHTGKHYQIKCEALGTPARSPRIPVWVGGGWPGTKPFKRAALWDGVSPMANTQMEGGRMEPDDISDMKALIQSHRTASGPFDITFFGRTAERPMLPDYEQAGVTWWVETGTVFGESLADIRAHIRGGPPIERLS